MIKLTATVRIGLAVIAAAGVGRVSLRLAAADAPPAAAPPALTVTGEVVDEATGQLIPSRLYIQHADGRWFFPESAAPGGSAIRYERKNWLNTNAVENHTTLSAHPFRVQLPPGVPGS